MNINKAFTLIELLIVITILGVLSGILVTIINPARQTHRAREAGLKTIVEKMCFGLSACGSAEVSATECDTEEEINVTNPSLDPSYLIQVTSVPAGDPYATVTIRGEIPSFENPSVNCVFECSYDFATTDVVEVHPAGTNCIIN